MKLSRRSLRKGLILSIAISVAGILLLLTFTKDDLSAESLLSVEGAYILGAFIAILGSWISKSIRLQHLCRGMGYSPSVFYLFKVFLTAAFVAHVTPSTSGGIPVQIYLLHKWGIPLGKSSALSLLDSMLTTAFFIAAGSVLLFLWRRNLSLSPEVSVIMNFAIAVIFLLVLLFFAVFFNQRLLKSIISWVDRSQFLARLFGKDRMNRFSKWLDDEFRLFREGMDSLLSTGRRNFAWAIFYTLLYWIFYLAIAPIILLGLNVKVNLVRVLLAQIVFNIVQPFIPTPGGSGGSEVGFAYLFRGVVPRGKIGIFVGAWRFFTFWASLIVGGFFFMRFFRGYILSNGNIDDNEDEKFQNI